MNRYWNIRTKNLTPYVPGEQPKDRKFIKLNTNENPYPPSPKVIEAIQKSVNDSLRLYPDPECTELRGAIAGRYGVKPVQVFAGNGSDEILGFAFGAFFEDESEECAFCSDSYTSVPPIIFPDITYSFYPVYSDLWKIPYQTIPLCKSFTVKINDYKTPSGGVILPNPNAPTGIAISLEDILSLAEYLVKQSKVLIIDEAYAPFGAQSAVSEIEKYPNLLTIHTLSKFASLAGLRTGFAIGHEKLIEGLCRMRDSFNSYTMDRLALAGAKAAIEDSGYYDKINRRVIVTREQTAKELESLGFSVLPSSANFLFVKPQNKTAKEYFAILRDNGILVRHFNKDRIKNYLRISIGTDEEMEKFINVCREING
jgi:histidinol-phosphate aminotransferase